MYNLGRCRITDEIILKRYTAPVRRDSAFGSLRANQNPKHDPSLCSIIKGPAIWFTKAGPSDDYFIYGIVLIVSMRCMIIFAI